MLASLLLSSHHSSYFFSVSPPYLSFPALFPWPVLILLYKRHAHGVAWRLGFTNIYTLLFIISVISILGVGCLRGQHPAVNNQIKVNFPVLLSGEH